MTIRNACLNIDVGVVVCLLLFILPLTLLITSASRKIFRNFKYVFLTFLKGMNEIM